MQIDSIEDIKILVSDLDNLFMNLEDKKKELEDQIKIKEAEQEDYLHEIELASLNGIEIMKIAKLLKQTRKERRILKDKLSLVLTLKGYVDKYITKGIVADTKQVITNIETLQNNQKNREYTPRVIKDLKCAKKKKE